MTIINEYEKSFIKEKSKKLAIPKSKFNKINSLLNIYRKNKKKESNMSPYPITPVHKYEIGACIYIIMNKTLSARKIGDCLNISDVTMYKYIKKIKEVLK